MDWFFPAFELLATVVILVGVVYLLHRKPEQTNLMRLEPYVTCVCSNNHIWTEPSPTEPLCPWCGAPARVWSEHVQKG